MSLTEGSHKLKSKCPYVRFGVVAILGFVVGILIGRFGTCPSPESNDKLSGVFLPGVSESLMRDEDTSVIDELMKSINAENIRNNLK